MEKYDVFVSHAHADKESIAAELQISFKKLGIRVFYDTDSIEWGDDWAQKIKDGLANCRFGVIIISKDFYDRTWTEKELKSLLVRQNNNGENVILPILFNTDIDELKSHCSKNCYKELSKIQFIRFPEDADIKDITIMLAKKLLADKADNSNDSSGLSNTEIFDEFFKGHSYEFNLWLDTLIKNNNDWMDDYDEDFIGWHHLTVNGEPIQLIQQRHREHNNSMMPLYGDIQSKYQYRINPIYFKDFSDYFNKKIKPQM